MMQLLQQMRRLFWLTLLFVTKQTQQFLSDPSQCTKMWFFCNVLSCILLFQSFVQLLFLGKLLYYASIWTLYVMSAAITNISNLWSKLVIAFENWTIFCSQVLDKVYFIFFLLVWLLVDIYYWKILFSPRFFFYPFKSHFVLWNCVKFEQQNSVCNQWEKLKL
jgi:hypothetical protein